MELLSALGHVLHELARFKLGAVFLCKSLHHTDVVINPNGVEVAEGSSTEGRKTSAKNQSDISNDRVGDDLILEAHDSLVHEPVKSWFE